MRRIFVWGALGLIAAGAGAVGGTGIVAAQNENAAGNPGQALYRARCASCHDGGASRAPSRAAME
ncbi:MAG: hypothetical protein WB559_15320, partial [Candidatus Acidiferrales bacterium]